MPRVSLLLLLLSSVAVPGCASLVLSGQAGQHPASDSRTAAEREQDGAIARRVNAVFVKDPLVPALDVRVSVLRGVVTLRGRVASDAVRERAVALALGVPGVRRVTPRFNVSRTP